MSWETINEILGLAVVDDDFCQQLLKHPLTAIQRWGFHLTHEEEETMRQIAVETLPELSQIVFDKLAPTGRKSTQASDHNESAR